MSKLRDHSPGARVEIVDPNTGAHRRVRIGWVYRVGDSYRATKPANWVPANVQVTDMDSLADEVMRGDVEVVREIERECASDSPPPMGSDADPLLGGAS